MVFTLCATLAADLPGTVDVAPVWSGHPVGFCLLTHGHRQFVAYYDADRTMTVAARSLDETTWHTRALPEKLGWDSHNYVTLAIDDAGRLHLSGNMHGVPLKYYRTREPLDIDTFEPAAMVGDREDRVTYPRFFRGPEGAFLFTYRDGRSGNGEQIFNVYDTPTRTWRRLLDTPLTSGNGKANAYLQGPIPGPDGWYHMVWVWRDHPGCESNHDPSYARSRDLIHWENAAGAPLTLPLTMESPCVVDPVPAGGGVINGNVELGFDGHQRPVVSYHKYDAHGVTQVYNARFENGAWNIQQASAWDYRWEFRGGGAIVFEVELSAVHVAGTGRLRQTYTHVTHGSGAWLLDEATLTPLETIPSRGVDDVAPSKLTTDLGRRQAADSGSSDEPGVRYVLQWETLPANRDKPREGLPPPPSMLRVVRLAKP